MTVPAYTHKLPLKEFEVSESELVQWLSANISSYYGFSKDYFYNIHFNQIPEESELQSLDAFWESIVDDSAYLEDQAKQRFLFIEKAKIQYGIEVRSYLGYLCEKNSYTPVQYGQMLADPDLSLCSQLLISGALETCKGIIDAYTPTAYFTELMKTELSSELQKYITLASNL